MGWQKCTSNAFSSSGFPLCTVGSLSDSKVAYQNQHWDTIEFKHFQTRHTPAMWILSSYRTKLAKENRSWSSVIPICSLTRPKSALRQTCVNSFAIQTSLTYVDLTIIRNINDQRKQMQRLLDVRLSQLQFDKTKINIQTARDESATRFGTMYPGAFVEGE